MSYEAFLSRILHGERILPFYPSMPIGSVVLIYFIPAGVITAFDIAYISSDF